VPGLNFTMFVDQVERGEKRQTIRRHRKRPIKAGDYLYMFTGQRTTHCRPLAIRADHVGVEICIDTFTRRWAQLRNDEILALVDGFETLAEYQAWFEAHGAKPDDMYDVIRW